MGWITTEEGKKKWIDERGGKREGSGRKRKGVTKKVSLTLSEELWQEINEFEGTVADYIRELRKKVIETEELKKVTHIKHLQQKINQLAIDFDAPILVIGEDEELI